MNALLGLQTKPPNPDFPKLCRALSSTFNITSLSGWLVVSNIILSFIIASSSFIFYFSYNLSLVVQHFAIEVPSVVFSFGLVQMIKWEGECGTLHLQTRAMSIQPLLVFYY